MLGCDVILTKASKSKSGFFENSLLQIVKFEIYHANANNLYLFAKCFSLSYTKGASTLSPTISQYSLVDFHNCKQNDIVTQGLSLMLGT